MSFPLTDAQRQELLNMSDEQFMATNLMFTLPSGSRGMVVDEDGFPRVATMDDESSEGFSALQKECWNKFNKNPQVFTSVDDTAGHLAGPDFGFFHEEEDVQDYIDLIMEDSRNRLVSNFEKFVARAEIEGELFLTDTIHEDGFQEIDFIAPRALAHLGEYKGIVYHPSKPNFPLFYLVEMKEDDKEVIYAIPSIFVSEFPELVPLVRNHKLIKDKKAKLYRTSNKPVHKKFGGFQTFMIAWDRGYFTNRNISHLRTIIEWANHYENLKRYEIDHKRSSGAYLWTVVFDDIQAFKRWLSLTDEQRQATGLYQSKTPGGTVMLPPGMKMEVKNPNLSKISDADTDIMQMVISGLNSSEDMVTGSNSGTYASVKASRGPETDRKAIKTERFRRFLVYDFWKNLFRIYSEVKSEFKLVRQVEIATGFGKKEPKMGKKKVPVWKSMEITFPTSEVQEIESVAKAMLGVKHGSIIDTLGIPPSVVAKRLGFRNYSRMRLQHAAEDAKYPALATAVDAADSESQQENTELEGAKPGSKKPVLKKLQKTSTGDKNDSKK